MPAGLATASVFQQREVCFRNWRTADRKKG